MIFHEMKADIKAAPQGYTIVSAFSSDFNCNAGIQKAIGEMFDLNERKDHIKVSKSGNLAKIDNLYLLIVKDSSYDAPVWERFKKSVEEFKKKCVKNHITKIAMPRILAGKNGFEWDDVFDLFIDTFIDVDGHVLICRQE